MLFGNLHKFSKCTTSRIMINMNSPIIGIVIPCYNEEDILNSTSKKMLSLLEKLINKELISNKSFIVFVDDGSNDKTWEIIENLTNKSNIKGLKLSNNVGHQNALIAGLLDYNKDADALISIDADLQDDINVIEEMIQKFKSGVSVVYGARKGRKSDSFFKKNTALFFYNLMKLMKVDIIHNHADFRLCSNKVINALSEFGEVNLFLRGIIPKIGFSKEIIYYDRLKREQGESKYPLRKMISFAWNGITSFSNFPLKIVSFLGITIFIFCLLMSIYALITLYLNKAIPGWFSTVLPLYFLGGIQLFSLSIIGEYIGKIYSESKKRPRYFIEKKID